MAAIFGHTDAGFAAVKAAFAANFSARIETGAACSLYYKGKCVVDLWGGIADIDTGRLWQEDSIQLVFSAAKGITTVCVLRLAEQGKLDLDAPIASYWPEFAANGKGQITPRMVLAHRAGLAAVDGNLTLKDVLDWTAVVNAIAAQQPNWEPGTAHGYHARSFGWILGEIVRRISDVSLGTYLQQEIAQPLGLNLWIGVPAAQLSRCTRVIPPPGGSQNVTQTLGANSLTARVMNGPSGLFDYTDMWNQPDLLMAEMPSSNLVTDARSLAKFYAAILSNQNRDPLLSAACVKSACAIQSQGPDKVILIESVFGTGFSLPPMLAPECGPASFGHPGAGGSLGFADPDAELSFAYVTNHMRFDPTGDPRTAAILKAVYAAI